MAPPTSNSSAKKQALTLAQLSSYDDILTDALVDRVCMRRVQFLGGDKGGTCIDD